MSSKRRRTSSPVENSGHGDKRRKTISPEFQESDVTSKGFRGEEEKGVGRCERGNKKEEGESEKKMFEFGSGGSSGSGSGSADFFKGFPSLSLGSLIQPLFPFDSSSSNSPSTTSSSSSSTSSSSPSPSSSSSSSTPSSSHSSSSSSSSSSFSSSSSSSTSSLGQRPRFSHTPQQRNQEEHIPWEDIISQQTASISSSVESPKGPPTSAEGKKGGENEKKVGGRDKAVTENLKTKKQETEQREIPGTKRVGDVEVRPPPPLPNKSETTVNIKGRVGGPQKLSENGGGEKGDGVGLPTEGNPSGNWGSSDWTNSMFLTSQLFPSISFGDAPLFDASNSWNPNTSTPWPISTSFSGVNMNMLSPSGSPSYFGALQPAKPHLDSVPKNDPSFANKPGSPTDSHSSKTSSFSGKQTQKSKELTENASRDAMQGQPGQDEERKERIGPVFKPLTRLSPQFIPRPIPSSLPSSLPSSFSPLPPSTSPYLVHHLSPSAPGSGVPSQVHLGGSEALNQKGSMSNAARDTTRPSETPFSPPFVPRPLYNPTSTVPSHIGGHQAGSDPKGGGGRVNSGGPEDLNGSRMRDRQVDDGRLNPPTDQFIMSSEVIPMIEESLNRIEHEIRNFYEVLATIRAHLISIHTSCFQKPGDPPPAETNAPPTPATFNSLIWLQQNLRGAVIRVQHDLEQCFDEYILSFDGLARVTIGRGMLHVITTQLAIYERETQFLFHLIRSKRGGGNSVPVPPLSGLASLIFIEQPLPASSLKGSVLRDGLVFALLVPATIPVTSVGEVEVTATYSFPGKFPIKNNKQPLNPPALMNSPWKYFTFNGPTPSQGPPSGKNPTGGMGEGEVADEKGRRGVPEWSFGEEKVAYLFPEKVFGKRLTIAKFDELCFTHSSRQQFVRLVGRVTVQVPSGEYGNVQFGGPSEIQSELSDCSIVMANQPSQWADSEVSILIQDTFHRPGEERDLLHVSLSRFLNCLQTRLVRITRCFTRPLMWSEFRMIQKTLGRQRTLSRHDVEQFWGWFGVAFRNVRDPRKNMCIWTQGLVSFITKEDAEEIVQSELPGSFVLRFNCPPPFSTSPSSSSTQPTSASALAQGMDYLDACVKQQNSIEHIQIKFDQKKKIADILANSAPELDRVCRVIVCRHTGDRTFTPFPKMVILSRLMSTNAKTTKNPAMPLEDLDLDLEAKQRADSRKNSLPLAASVKVPGGPTTTTRTTTPEPHLVPQITPLNVALHPAGAGNFPTLSPSFAPSLLSMNSPGKWMSTPTGKVDGHLVGHTIPMVSPNQRPPSERGPIQGPYYQALSPPVVPFSSHPLPSSLHSPQKPPLILSGLQNEAERGGMKTNEQSGEDSVEAVSSPSSYFAPSSIAPPTSTQTQPPPPPSSSAAAVSSTTSASGTALTSTTTPPTSSPSSDSTPKFYFFSSLK